MGRTPAGREGVRGGDARPLAATFTVATLPALRAIPRPALFKNCGSCSHTNAGLLAECCALPTSWWCVQVDEGSLGEAGKNWPRPVAPQLNPGSDKLGTVYGQPLAPPMWGVGGSPNPTAALVPALLEATSSQPPPKLVSNLDVYLPCCTCPLPSAPACPAVFQQLEVDYAMGAPHHSYYPTDLKEVPVLRMYGVTESGNSVATFVHGFEPYFYVEAPSPSFSTDDCQALASELNVRAVLRHGACMVQALGGGSGAGS